MKRNIIFIVALLPLLLLSSCKQETLEDRVKKDLLGTWKLSSILVNDFVNIYTMMESAPETECITRATLDFAIDMSVKLDMCGFVTSSTFTYEDGTCCIAPPAGSEGMNAVCTVVEDGEMEIAFDDSMMEGMGMPMGEGEMEITSIKVKFVRQ